MVEDNRPNAIVVKDLHKSFKLPHERHSGLKQAVVNIFNTKRGYESQKVLKDISFDIKQGEFFGIVGRNGSGKSTLLKLLAGIYVPDKGLVQVNGSLTPFIELGVGFNPELTGRENVFLNGALLGFDRKQMEAMYKEIVEFAELGNFMDQKLKNYSSGMQVRLAFSIAIRANTDILLLDEVLAVGDAAFQTKCYNYFYELKEKGSTVVFVSHDRGSLERFCENGVLIDKGKIVIEGPMKTVLKSYSEIVLEELDESDNKSETQSKTQRRVTSPYATIEKVGAYDHQGLAKRRFTFGSPIYIKFEVKIKKTLVNPIFGITVWQKHLEKPIFAKNTLMESNKGTGNFKAGDKITFEIKIPNLLNDGEYYIEPAIANESASVFYDQRPEAANFFVSGSDNPNSIISNEEKIILNDHKNGLIW